MIFTIIETVRMLKTNTIRLKSCSENYFLAVFNANLKFQHSQSSNKSLMSSTNALRERWVLTRKVLFSRKIDSGFAHKFNSDTEPIRI